MSNNAPCMIHTTCPGTESAETLADELIARKLAACVSIGSPVTSRYPWQGRVETDREVPLTIKTMTTRVAAVQRLVDEVHPYEVPEFLVVPVSDGSPAYLAWLGESVDAN